MADKKNSESSQPEAQKVAPPTGISGQEPETPGKESWLTRWHDTWLAKQKSMGKGKTLMYWIGYLAGSFIRQLWGTRPGNAYTVPDYSNPKRGADDSSGGGKGAASPPTREGQQVTGITSDRFHAAEIISSAGASKRTQEQQQKSQTLLEGKKGTLGAITLKVQTACLKGVESTSLYVAAKLKALAGFVQAKLKPRTEQRSGL